MSNIQKICDKITIFVMIVVVRCISPQANCRGRLLLWCIATANYIN